MNASNPFRSNLMQQLASAALKGQRPPLALAGWLQASVDPGEDETAAPAAAGRPSARGRPRLASASSSSRTGMLSSIGGSSSSHLTSLASAVASHEPSAARFPSPTTAITLPMRQAHAAAPSDAEDEADVDQLARGLQQLIQTRRSGSKFLPRDVGRRDAPSWRGALERAVLCAVQAPNHKRTEPVTFKRLVAPSERTHRLSEIAYETHLRRKLASLSPDASDDEITAMRRSVEKKRQKWDQIPAFLVALVDATRPVVRSDEVPVADPYEPLPFQPLNSEREMEDYATACSSVQNCLLSLHSEHIAAKWATGPVVQTPAFRDLVDAKEHDRVVALIMVGENDDSQKPRRRRMRREFHGDVLVDL